MPAYNTRRYEHECVEAQPGEVQADFHPEVVTYCI
jgi:hypothetical protein